MDQEQDNGRRRIDWNRMGHGFAIGLFVGIAVYAAATKGLGFFTVLPLLFAYLIFRNGRRAKGVEQDKDDGA
ncbi:MAG: hypothetical protein H6592_02555 [Flavobacteriales bacterium]|nr:hypothetical protein [Flavobacteriales bacterium]